MALHPRHLQALSSCREAAAARLQLGTYPAAYRGMDKDYNDIYFVIIVGIASFIVILATGIYIESL